MRRYPRKPLVSEFNILAVRYDSRLINKHFAVKTILENKNF